MAESKRKSKAPTLTIIRNLMKKHEHVWFKKPFSVNVVGYRTADTNSNTFNDWMTVSWLDDNGMWFFRRWPITTDPGTYYREHPMNSKGTAVLKCGQYRGMWALGMFKGQYQALLQVGPCTVWRDNDKNETIDIDGASEDYGRFGICGHRASASRTSTVVDRWSAGCQVFADPDNFDEFLAIVRYSMRTFGPKVSYTLLAEE